MSAALVAPLRRWLDSRSDWRRIGINAGWLLVEKGVRWAVGLSVGVWLARYLGPDLYGRLGYAQAVVAVLASIAFLGAEGVIVRELVRTPAARRPILVTAVWFRLVGGSIGYLLALAAAATLAPDGQTLLLVAISGLSLLAGIGDVIDLWFQAEVKGRTAALGRSAGLLASALLRGILILNEASLVAFAWTIAIEALLTTVGMALVFPWRTLASSASPAAPGRGSAYLRECWPNLISGLAMMTYMRVDRIMLGYLDGERSVGLFNAAALCVEVWYILPMTIVASATPLITRLREENPAAYLVEIARMARLLAGSAWVLAAALTVAAPWLAGGLFGSDYREAAPAVSILAWGLLFANLGVAVSPWYLNEGLMLPAMWRHLLGAACNVALNFLLIPRWGLTGAATATVLAFAIAHVLANALDPRTRPIFHLQIRALLLRAPVSSS